MRSLWGFYIILHYFQGPMSSANDVIDVNPHLREFYFRERLNEGFTIPEYLINPADLERIRPPAVVRPFGELIGELPDEERSKLAHISKLVADSEWFEPKLMSDGFILRFAKARSFDATKTIKMIEAHLEWRRGRNWEQVRCEVCVADPNQHISEFVGWDNLHRPIIFHSMRLSPSRTDPEEATIHEVEIMNHMPSLMPEGVTQWVSITDFLTFSYLRDTSPKMGSAVVKTMMDHFPERLGLKILVDPPAAFWVFWKLLSPLIDDRTKAKVLFVYTDSTPNIDEEFPKLFPPHVAHYLATSYRSLKALK